MSEQRGRLLCKFSYLLSLCSLASTAAPQVLRIDGSIFNASGVPVSGNRDIQIKAYDAASGGSAVWTSSVYTAVVSNGRFAIGLDATADTTSLTDRLAAKAASGEIWFEIIYDTGAANGSMDSPVTVSARIRGKGSMFALVAAKADALNGVTTSVAEMNRLAGITSSVQSQIDSAFSAINSIPSATTRVAKTGDSMNGALDVGASINAQNFNLNLGSGQFQIGGNSFIGVGTGVDAANLYVGRYAGAALTGDAGANTFVGFNAGAWTSTGDANSFFGASSGWNNDTGNANTFIGDSSGYGNVSGINNTFLGAGAAYGNQSGSKNTILGAGAGYFMASSDENVIVGYGAGYTVSSMGQNTLVGPYTNADTTVQSAVALGLNAVVAAGSAIQLGAGVNSTANSLQFQGYNFLDKNGNATFNSINTNVSSTELGYLDGATANIQTQINSLGGGSYVAKGGDTMTGKLFVSGQNIGTSGAYEISGKTVLNVGASERTLVGISAGISSSGSTQSTFVGTEAGGGGNITGDRVTALGFRAGYGLTTGNDNTLVGYQAGKALTGDENAFFGSNAGQAAGDVHWSTMLGHNAGYSTNSGDYNTFIGNNAGYTNTTGEKNVFVGYYSGYTNGAGAYNAFLGNLSGRNNDSGTYNTFLGWEAGRSNTTASYNTYVGADAGYTNTGGTRNSYLGFNAGYNASGASDNTLMGYQAGDGIGAGGRNVYIGSDADGLSGVSMNVAIGYTARTDANSAIQIGWGTNSTPNSVQFWGTNFSQAELGYLDGVTSSVQSQIQRYYGQTCNTGYYLAGWDVAGAMVCNALPSTISYSKLGTSAGKRCAVVTDGTVQCWGLNAWGQLGDGTTTVHNKPDYVRNADGSKLSSVSQVAGGYYHTCALKTDGTVWCWGYNGNKNLGDGGTTTSNYPVQVIEVTGAVQLSSQWHTSCARITNGTIKCWGYNGHGQVGDNTTTDRSTAVTVLGITTAVDVAQGGTHACAVLADGTAKCWGYNGNGGIGDGTTGTLRYSPVAVIGLTGVTSMSTNGNTTNGHNQSCAVKNDGTAWCWGLNSNYQLGDGTITARNSPVQVVASGVNFTKIATGCYYACALVSGGTAKCWGYNAYGQLGDGSVTQRTSPVTVVNASGSTITGITDLMVEDGTASSYFGTSLIVNGTVQTFGDNQVGQHGQNTTDNSTHPTPRGAYGP